MRVFGQRIPNKRGVRYPERLLHHTELMGGKAQEEWGKLSDDDMKIIEDEWAQLIGRLRNKGGSNEAR